MKVVVIVLLLCLIAIFFQDWKYRKIHVAFPIIIFVTSFFIIKQALKIRLELIAFNLFFFLLTLSILTMYMSIKNKNFLNPFQHYFGLGDLLFYIAITPFFNLKNYVIFFISSMIFAILLQLGLKKVIQQETIPLAGFSSLLLIIIIVTDLLFNFQKATIL